MKIFLITFAASCLVVHEATAQSGCPIGFICYNDALVIDRPCGTQPGDYCVPAVRNSLRYHNPETTTPDPHKKTLTSATAGESPGCPPGYQCFDSNWNPIYDRVCGTVPSDTCFPEDVVGTTTTVAPSTTTQPPYSGCPPGYQCFDSNWNPINDRVCGTVPTDTCFPEDVVGTTTTVTPSTTTQPPYSECPPSYICL